MKTWFIYTPSSWDVHKFDSKEKMLENCADVLESVYLDGNSGWSDDVYCAVAGYGELPDMIKNSDEWEDAMKPMQTHKVAMEMLDEKENYSGEEDDEWPYCDDFDYIARFYLQEIEPAGGE